jgi:hypothetical protein
LRRYAEKLGSVETGKYFHKVINIQISTETLPSIPLEYVAALQYLDAFGSAKRLAVALSDAQAAYLRTQPAFDIQ